MNTVNTIATDTAVKGVNKQPIADGVGLGKTSVPTPPPPPVVEPGRCSAGQPRCRAPARLYAAGWRCDDHRPGTNANPQPGEPACQN